MKPNKTLRIFQYFAAGILLVIFNNCGQGFKVSEGLNLGTEVQSNPTPVFSPTPVPSVGTPTIQSVAGNISHAASLTIMGTNFGSKSQAAPVIWDNCPSNGVSDEWTGVWPSRSSNPSNNTQCRLPIQNVSPPHSYSQRYYAGNRSDGVGADAGYNVLLFKNRQITSYPAYSYISYYHRADDNWSFCGDNNFKNFAFGSSDPYSGNYFYSEYNDTFNSRTSTGGLWHLNNVEWPDRNGHNLWWGGAVNPHAGKWSKIEMELAYTRDGSGYIKMWENGRSVMDYRGQTDFHSGTERSEGIGGYMRCAGINNWRYFADVYLDHSRARVVIANNANLENATFVEPQIPTSWNSNRIDVSINLGAVPSGPIYLFITNPEAKRSAGFQLR